MEHFKEKTFQHTVQFYDLEDSFIDGLADYFKIGIEKQEICIVIATKSHRDALEKRLMSLGVDVKGAKAANHYIPMDAAQTLAHFMINGSPNPISFGEVISSLIPRYTRRPIRAFGEMVVLLWNEGNKTGALQLEELWNALGKVREFSLLCSYPLRTFGTEDTNEAVQLVSQVHSHIISPAI